MRREPQSDLEVASDLARYEVPSMGNSLDHGSQCGDPREHDAEAFCLAGSVLIGCWETAGLIPEVDSAGCIWGWKSMRCGCRFIVLMYPSGSAQGPRTVNRPKVKGRNGGVMSGLRQGSTPPLGAPEGGSRPRSNATGLIAGSTTPTGSPFAPLGIGSGGPA